jgi:hypothetical protein
MCSTLQHSNRDDICGSNGLDHRSVTVRIGFGEGVLVGTEDFDDESLRGKYQQTRINAGAKSKIL